MALPLAVVIGTVVVTLSGVVQGIRSKIEEEAEKLDSEEQNNILKILQDDLGITHEEMESVDYEIDLASLVRQKMQSMSNVERKRILDELQFHLDKDEYFRYERWY